MCIYLRKISFERSEILKKLTNRMKNAVSMKKSRSANMNILRSALSCL